MSTVNVFDIITLIVALWAIISGWRKGLILQFGSLVGIVLALFFASRYAVRVGTLFHFSEAWVKPGGFIVVALLTLLLVALTGRLLRSLLQVAGLGVVDILLGIALSLAKWLLLLSAIYSAFAAVNSKLDLVQRATLEESKSFKPICRVVDYVMPFVSKTLHADQVEKELEELLPDSIQKELKL